MHNSSRFLTLLFALASLVPTISAAERPPNVIFVIADDMHRHMFNCLPEGEGKNLTPNLDQLAKEGVLMLGQHVSSPVCTPSRYSCLTGRYASRSKSETFLRDLERNGQSVVQWNSFITEEDSLPRQLQRAGYATGFVGKNHVFEGDVERVGYREDPRDAAVAARLRKRQQQAEEIIRDGGFDYVASLYYENPDHNGPRELAVHNLDWTTSGALKFIADNKEKPFFLYYATTTPHGPGEPDRSWNADPKAIPTGYLKEPLDVLPPRDTIPTRLREAGLRTEASRCNTLWLDDSLGAIMTRLRELKIDDNTIVLFFNDHGQAAKGTLYQGGVSSPSIIWRAGGFPCGSVSEAAVSNIDFAPTLLDLADVEYDEKEFDGRTFAPLLTGESYEPRDSLYFEMGYTRAVIKGEWKLLSLRYPERVASMPLAERQAILNKFNANQRERGRPVYTIDPGAPFSHISLIPGGGDAEAVSTGKRPGYYDHDQLYHLSTDPKEEKNLANDPKYAEMLSEMKAELSEYIDDLPGGFADLLQVEVETALPPAHPIHKEGIHDYFYFSDEFLLHSNLWGAHAMKDDVPEFTFNFRHDKTKPLSPLSYDWTISTEFRTPIFPFFGYGDRMWRDKPNSTTTRLPIRVGDLETCKMRYRLKVDAESIRKSKGNLAVDVWFGDKPVGNDNTMRTEIMLWFDRNEQYPIGAKNHEGTYDFGGVKWDLYIGELSPGGTVVCTFIAQKPTYAGDVDFMIPLNVVKEKGHIDDSSYLGGFEIGNEIYRGRGSTEIEQFHVDIRPKGFPRENVTEQWLFDKEPTGKRAFAGDGGIDTKAKNETAVAQRSVAVRFRVDDAKPRQVVYKEGGKKNGLSIYVAAGKVHVANWNTATGEADVSILSGKLPEPKEPRWKHPATYAVVVATVDTETGLLTAYLNGVKIGAKEFHGLSAKRGVTTLGYSDTPVHFYDGLSTLPYPLTGVIDDVIVFDKALAAEEAATIQ